MIEYGKQNNNGLVQNFSGFSGSLFGRLAGIRPSWSGSTGCCSLGSDGNPKI